MSASISELFETISNSVLNGEADLKAVRSECDKLLELATQIGETREVSKIKQVEDAIENLNNLKKSLGSEANSKHIDDAIKGYTSDLEALKKQAAAIKKTTPPKTDVWKQQVGKKQVREDVVVLQKAVYGLGNGIEILCYNVDNDQNAPAGVVCRRKDGSLFIIINHQVLEIPQCTFNVRGDNDSDAYTVAGTKFYNPDLDNGSQDVSRYADIDCPQGNDYHVPHHVNKDGVNRTVRKQKFIPANAAAAERGGLMSSGMIDLFSALNVRTNVPQKGSEKK
jgi:hypothetical protein